MAEMPEGLSGAAKVRWKRTARTKANGATQQSTVRSPARNVQLDDGAEDTVEVAASATAIQSWCRGRQLRLQMKQPPSLLAGLPPNCLSCAIRCAWAYNQSTLQRTAASGLASALAAAAGAPSAVVVLQAASELLGGLGNTSRLVAAVLDERFDVEWIYARHLAGLAFDFASCALICELILDAHSSHGVSDNSSTLLSAAPPRATTPPRSPTSVDRDKVDGQIGRLESIERIVQESVQRLAEVKRRMQTTNPSPPTEGRQADGRYLTRHSISSLQERRCAVDARMEKLVKRHGILGQRIEFGASRGSDLDSDDGHAGSDVGRGQLLPAGYLESLRSLLLRAGSPEGATEESDSGINSCDRRSKAEWRRALQPFADEAGQLTWHRFREAMLSTLYGLDGSGSRAAVTSDLALHALFDTLDTRCSDAVLIDELHRFLCTESVEEYVRDLQSAASVEIREARSESAGLQAWIQAKKPIDAPSDDDQRSPSAGFQFEVYVGGEAVPSYTPFAAQDMERLTSAQRQDKWREQTWKQVRSAISHRKVFGRTYNSAGELFSSMVVGSESDLAGGARTALVRYEDIAGVLHRLGLGFTDAAIAKLLSDVDVDPNHKTVHLDRLLAVVSQ